MALDYWMGLDANKLPIVGSRWEYLDTGKILIVKEVIESKK